MAKRNGKFDSDSSKKPKLDDFNDFWDDDLDGDLIDDCFERATQVCEEEAKSSQYNVSLLPSYSRFFKEPSRGMFTSTQNSQANEADHKMKELQDKYAEKEGEVCILRSNLQNLRTSCQAEQEKKDNEWKNKLSSTQKENKTIRSELEFKNLEIANLKQQIAELSKFANAEQATQKAKTATPESRNLPIHFSKIANPQEATREVAISNPEIQINSEKYYPLKRFDFSFIFRARSEEKYVPKTKYNLYKSTISYLQHQPEADFVEKCSLVGEKELSLDYVYAELAYLISLSEDELDSEVAVEAINKVVCVSLQLSTDFHSYLRQVEDHIQLQDIQESDSVYLQDNARKKFENLDDFRSPNGIGVKCGTILGFLAEILPFSAYFRNYLLQDRPLKLDESSDYIKLLPNVTQREKSHYLSMLSNIVSIIGKTRKEHICTEFLSAVVKLLARIFANEGFSSFKRSVICELTREILFLRPDFVVIYHITSLLKVASRTPDFIDVVCFKAKQNANINSATKGVVCFSRESCRFHIFVILLENILPKIENENVLLRMSLNILNFIHNIFKSNDPWLYQQEHGKSSCNCLCQLYKLGIGIIYKNLKSFRELRSKASVYRCIFRNGIKILSLLAFNSYELTQKYVTDFAQFKEIVYTLSELHGEVGLDEGDVRILEKLNTAEDVPEVSADVFIGVEL